jgi:transcriptional regulator with XRE-family HTH domain
MHDGEIVKLIRLLRGFNQTGAGMGMDISQQAFAKWEKKEFIPQEQLTVILKALNSSQREFDTFKNLPPPR